MRLWPFIRNIDEWLPIIAIPFAIQIMTDNFSRPFGWEAGSVIAFCAIINLGWIGLLRAVRRQQELETQYPGFRWKKFHG